MDKRIKAIALTATTLLLVGNAAAQASKPPNLIPDASMAARQMALAKAQAIAPAGKYRGEAQVTRASPTNGHSCTVNVAALPEKREGASKLGTINQTVVVEGSPIVICGPR